MISLFCAAALHASTQDVELLADNVSKNGDVVNAEGNVIMYSKEYLITANKAVYDQKNEIVEFFGNVNSLRGLNETSRTNYLRLNLKSKEDFATENFIMDKEAEIWMQNNESCSDDGYYRTKGSVVSSCNIQDPDWRIKYSSGKLNKETKFLHLYNPVFYAGDVPVFYLPYFGFPTDKTRRSGLLIPEIGYMKNEGVYYKQPIYLAPYESWDLQFDPQVRSRRGFGIYTTFRFADSPYSYGEIRGGIFDNFKRAQEKLEYKNEKHHGIEFEYDRSKLAKYLIDGDFKEQLWIDFKKVNDVEYFDLKEKGGLSDDDDSLVASRLNYYLTTDEHYFGLYSRYYIDTDKLNKKNTFRNDDTIQELPTLQYHKFSNSLFLDNLIYSVDTKYHNYTRSVGTEASQYELNIPLSFSLPLFNDYLNLKFSENLYATHIDYRDNFLYRNGGLSSDDSANYVNHYHRISLSTDLAKAYDSFYHTVNFELDYIVPGYQSGDINSRLFKEYQYDYDKERGRVNQNRLNDIASNLYYEDNFLGELGKDYTQRNFGAKFTEYIYDENGRKFIRHSVRQRYDFEDEELGDLTHRLDLYFKNGFSIGNRFEYSHENHEFEKIQTYARYADTKFSASINHTYENVKRATDRYDKDNYTILNASVNLPNFYKVFGSWEYDWEREYNKMWRLGVTHNRRCWNYTFVYQEDIEPRTSSSLSYEKAKKEQGFYFFVNFYPFGGVSYDFSKDKEYKAANQ
ncbi:putative periplasmic protein [Campylobacter geochelonis]|nr:LPS assembly protein LptD [Campylobacter geochelonis]CZE48910.1 putative periplasmic protein [Campylobacter geochelonis]